jgi:hypothetical protein
VLTAYYPELNTVEVIYPLKEKCCQKELGFILDDVVKLIEETISMIAERAKSSRSSSIHQSELINLRLEACLLLTNSDNLQDDSDRKCGSSEEEGVEKMAEK